MTLRPKSCEHLKSLKVTFSIEEKVCKDCLKTGDQWVHLRMCKDCGYIGCCDSSKNKHATKHHEKTKHPVIVSAEEGESWAWCYAHEIFKKL